MARFFITLKLKQVAVDPDPGFGGNALQFREVAQLTAMVRSDNAFRAAGDSPLHIVQIDCQGSGSMSQNTGVAPRLLTTWKMDAHVNEGMMISSPGCAPSAQSGLQRRRSSACADGMRRTGVRGKTVFKLGYSRTGPNQRERRVWTTASITSSEMSG
jgi:hypothetical protein